MENLKQHIAHSIFWNYASAVVTHVISLACAIWLTKLLTPDDFGIITAISIVLGVGWLFVGQGYAQAIVKEKNIGHNGLSTIFWINAAVGLLLVLLSVALGDVLGQYFDIDHFDFYISFYSIAALFDALKVVQINVLKRDLRFKEISIVQMLSTLVGVVLVLILAYSGFGVLSLIWRAIISSFVLMLGCWYLTKWTPSFLIDLKSLEIVRKFSNNVFSTSIVNYISNKLDSFLIVKLLGSADLGIFNRAETFTYAPAEQIKLKTSQVAYSALSKIENKTEFNKTLFQLILQINTIIVPLILVVLLSSEQLINKYLDPSWASLSDLILLMGVVSIFIISGLPQRSLMARNQSDTLLKYQSAAAVLKLVPLIGVFWYRDLISIVSLVVIGKLLAATMINYAAYKDNEVKFNDVWKYQILPGVLAVAVYLIAVVIDPYLPGNIWTNIFLKSIGGLVLFGALYWWFYRDFLNRVWLQVRGMLG